ncbi:MAG: glycerate kinase type-2 family protein [Terriglobales bacterium]
MSSCERARRCFAHALAALDPRALVRERASRLAPAPDGRERVIAAGKAAVPMLAGWLDAQATPAEIVLVHPAGTPGLPPDLAQRCTDVLCAFVAGHPEPDAVSLSAGAAALALARRCGPQTPLTVLLSGGASALMEVTWQGGLEPLRERNRLLLGSGAAIGEINCIRKHGSALKGGRLALAASGAQQRTLILSDVPPGAWADVASGPTCPDASTNAIFAAAWRRWLPGAPPEYPETPKPGDTVFLRSTWHCLADNLDACAALARAARAQGYEPAVDSTTDEWEEERAAEYLLQRWRALGEAQPRACLIAGGEVRVRLRAGHGRGGRNLALALRMAIALDGQPGCFLSAGTDGVDGSSDAAGACVDGSTAARIRAAGLDPAACLERQDAHAPLAAAGALVVTGPTGNNLRDLRLFCG